MSMNGHTDRYIGYYHPPAESPLGVILIRASDTGLSEIAFIDPQVDPQDKAADEAPRPHPHVQRCQEQLAEYFSGRRYAFDLSLDPKGTPFQRRVWEQLRGIPFGETRSYADIAARIGNLKAQRAVGAANGRNPLSIVVPCHRVIGSNGRLTGYAGGLPRKQWLLEHERQDLFTATRAPLTCR